MALTLDSLRNEWRPVPKLPPTYSTVMAFATLRQPAAAAAAAGSRCYMIQYSSCSCQAVTLDSQIIQVTVSMVTSASRALQSQQHFQGTHSLSASNFELIQENSRKLCFETGTEQNMRTSYASTSTRNSHRYSASTCPAQHHGGHPPESAASSLLLHHSPRPRLTLDLTHKSTAKVVRKVVRTASRHQVSISSSCSLVNQDVAAATARSASTAAG